MKRCVFLYVVILTIPLFLGGLVWQSTRYAELERSLKQVEQKQERLVEKNKRLIGGIAMRTSPVTIEDIAHKLGLSRITPEKVMQIRIPRGNKSDG